MNVFILNSGRCGSTTFIEACQQITNFTAGHETLLMSLGPERMAYPPDHIEADNRLSWLLGRLDRAYGNKAFYVHLRREKIATADSFARRMNFGIMKAYREGIFLREEKDDVATEVALDYLETVEENIKCFLKDKTSTMEFRLESAKEDFAQFWNRIGAEGDLEKALKAWDIHHNASEVL